MRGTPPDGMAHGQGSPEGVAPRGLKIDVTADRSDHGTAKSSRIPPMAATSARTQPHPAVHRHRDVSRVRPEVTQRIRTSWATIGPFDALPVHLFGSNHLDSSRVTPMPRCLRTARVPPRGSEESRRQGATSNSVGIREGESAQTAR
jgi:hypothetical protein